MYTSYNIAIPKFFNIIIDPSPMSFQPDVNREFMTSELFIYISLTLNKTGSHGVSAMENLVLHASYVKMALSERRLIAKPMNALKVMFKD